MLQRNSLVTFLHYFMVFETTVNIVLKILSSDLNPEGRVTSGP